MVRMVRMIGYFGRVKMDENFGFGRKACVMNARYKDSQIFRFSDGSDD